MSDLFNYEGMGDAGQDNAQSPPEDNSDVGQTSGAPAGGEPETQGDGAQADSNDQQASDSQGTDTETSADQGGDSAGDQGADDQRDTGNEVEYPRWLDQAKPEHREIKELWGKKNISELIDDYLETKKQVGQGEGPPENYELPGDYSDEISTQFDSFFRDAAKAAGLTQQQAGEFFKRYGEFFRGQKQRITEERNASYRRAEEQLRQQFPGAQYSEAMQRIKDTITGFAPEGTLNLLKEAQLDNNPVILTWLKNLGDALGEDQLIGRSTGSRPPQDTGAFEYGEQFESAVRE